jgi:hypothetical protein
MRSRRPAPGHFSGLISPLLCCLLVARPSASALQGGNSPLGPQAKENRPTKGTPVQNLPNLDGVRRRGPANPEGAAARPSKLKRASQCFKRFQTAERTLEGIEAVNMLRKGEVKR